MAASVPEYSPDWTGGGGESMCRVCLRCDPISMWSLFECNVAGKSLVEALSMVGGIQVQAGDNFPKSCCSDCLKRVEEAVKLREQCQESNRRLGQAGEVSIKDELPEFEEEEDSMVDGLVGRSHSYFEPSMVEEEHSVASVLQQFGLVGFLATVEGQDLETVEIFSCLLEQDLQKMLPNETIGTIIRFRKAVAHAKQLCQQRPTAKRKGLPPERPAEKRPRTEEVVLIPSQDHVNLADLLKTIEGQCIVTHYKKNGNQLDRQNQGKLLKLIIGHLAISFGMKDIHRSWFGPVFAAIVEAFPSEREFMEVYEAKFAQTKYNVSRKIGTGRTKPAAEQSNGVLISGGMVEEGEANASKQWLQRGRDPWETVLEHWRKSFQLRVPVYQSVSCVKLADLWGEDGWPILKAPTGIELIRKDFNRMFAPTNDIFHIWPRIRKGVCTFARLNLKNKTLLNVMASYEAGLRADDHLFLQLLSGLLSPGCTARKYKPRYEDSLNAFIREAKTIKEAEEAIEAYRVVLTEHNLTVQPHVLFISDEGRYLIYVDKGRYYTASGLLDAIDGVVKLCLVMGMSYMPDAKPMWTFMQRYCYGLKTDSDSSYACLRALHAFLLQAQE